MNFRHLKESIIDPAKKNVNPYVWKEKTINPLIRTNIVDTLTEKKIDFRELFIIGSITGKFWNEASDIDCTVFCDVDDVTLLAYRKITRIINERSFFGPFPINFYFRTDTVQDMATLADGIYDLLQDKWVKEPADTDAIEEILKNPKKLAERIARKLDIELDEISQDVIDIIENYKNKNFNLEDKLNFLELELGNYILEVDEIHKRRVEEFTKTLEGESLSMVRRTGSRNALPYNIIFKLLQKWLYTKWASIFKDVTKTDEIKINEVKRLFENFVKYWV